MAAKDTSILFTLMRSARTGLALALTLGAGAQPALPVVSAAEPEASQEPLPPPAQLVISKTVVSDGPVVHPGDVITYRITLEMVGGSLGVPTRITDVIPPLVEFLGPVDVAVLSPTVAAGFASFSGNMVTWAGGLAPGAKVGLRFPVRVRPCLDRFDGQAQAFVDTRPITNTAAAVQPNAPPVADSAAILVDCWRRPPIDIDKYLMLDDGAGGLTESTDAEVLNDTAVRFGFRVHNNSSAKLDVAVQDILPDGLAQDGGLGAFRAGSAANEVLAVVRVPGGGTRVLELPARVLVADARNCERDITNRGRAVLVKAYDGSLPGGLAQGDLGQPGLVMTDTNEVRLRVRCADLGDAPDSTNHFSVTMSAYPGVPANFPSTRDAATTGPDGLGPRHLFPQPIHLGPGVSREAEADIGPDSDGVRNINPLGDTANHDRFDDGVLLQSINFTDCRRAMLPVQVYVGPGAKALMTATAGIGYLNVWVDGNRDGDWADAQECPVEAGQIGPQAALEHIVIDHPVNIAALGAGLHVINVPTGRVPWPALMAAKPAWMRFTLSERPSNKTISLPVPHGDGRGFVLPFALGETEDFLWRPQGDPQRGPDVTVRKKGALKMSGDGPRIAWVIEYANVGTEPATGVIVRDEAAQAGAPAGPGVVADPPVPHVASAGMLTFSLGTLNPGQHGRIFFDTAPLSGTLVYTNRVAITATADVEPGNNRDAAVVALPALRAPLILEPGDGTTCDSSVAVRGRAQPGADVDLILDGILTATLPVDAGGIFSTTLGPLANGTHTLSAVARLGVATSDPSETRVFIVNTSLSWSPLSLRFTGSSGRSFRPTDGAGRTDETGWQAFLPVSETFTVSVKVCCQADVVSVTLVISNITVTLSDPELDKVFSGSFFNDLPRHTSAPMALTIDCGGSVTGYDTQALIDPDGQVYDVRDGALLGGSSVTCLAQTPAGQGAASTTYERWPAQQYEAQLNPQLLAADAHFAFFTPAGTYRVSAQRAGYQPYVSPDLHVVNAPVHFDVPLTAVITRTPRVTVTVTADGFEPAVVKVAPGAVVAFINADTAPHSATSAAGSGLARNGGAALTSSYPFDSGLLGTGDTYQFQFTTPGPYSFVDRNSGATGTILVAYTPFYLPLTLGQ